MKTETINVKGYGILKAWKPGEIERLLRDGYKLNEAMGIIRPVCKMKTHNLITTVGLNNIVDAFIGADIGPAYHAIGTGTTNPVIGDTTLTAEVSRRSVTSMVRTSSSVTVSTFFPVAECTYNIKESGVFGGSSASTSPDTGTLISHYLQSYDNTAGSYDLTFSWMLVINRGTYVPY